MAYRKNKQSTSRHSKGGDSGYNAFDCDTEPVECKPVQVVVYDNLERALKAFRAIVQKEKILSSYKEKQAYEKPSDKRRRKIKESERKNLPT
jgi:small subunit ribosomal protein S21